MNWHGLRSVCARARPGPSRWRPAPARYLSNSPCLDAENKPSDGAPTRTMRERSRAAVSQISSLLNDKKPSSPKPNVLPPSNQASGGPPKLIDVRSLPRGGLRGRASPRLAPGSGRLAGPARGAPGAALRRGPNAAGGSSVGGRRRGRRNPSGEEEGEKQKARTEDDDGMDPTLREFDEAMRFGTSTVYNPSLTLESLAEFMPMTPSATAAVALQNLRLLGRADPIGAPLDLQARSYAEDLEADGVRFFADAKAMEATEQYLQQKRRDEAEAAAATAATSAEQGEGGQDGAAATGVAVSEERIIQPPDETIKQVILDKAIAGRYEAPLYATEPVAVARSWHLRAETYSQADTDKFEAKLQSLLNRAARTGAARGKAETARAP